MATPDAASDPGGPKGPARRASSRLVSTIGALCAVLIAPLAAIAISSALDPAGASSEANPGLMWIIAVAALGLSAFGFVGARIGRKARSGGLAIYGSIVAGVLVASGVGIGIAAIINAVA